MTEEEYNTLRKGGESDEDDRKPQTKQPTQSVEAECGSTAHPTTDTDDTCESAMGPVCRSGWFK